MRRFSQAKKIFSLFSLLFFGSLGGVMVWLAVGAGLETQDVLGTYEKTTGKITEASIVPSHNASDYTYFPSVRYLYSVKGVPYEGYRIVPALEATADPLSFSKEGAFDFLERYGFEQGAQVDVYYDPQDPQQSVLFLEYSNSSWVFLGVVIFLGVMAVVGAISVMRLPPPKKKRRPRRGR